MVHPEAQLLSNGRVQRVVLTHDSLECPGEPPGLWGGTKTREDHSGPLPGVQRTIGQGSGVRDRSGQICWEGEKKRYPSA